MMQRKNIFYFSISILAALMGACNLEQEVQIELPVYEPKVVLECYLEPGKPFQLLLSRSASYFAPFDTSIDGLLQNLLVSGADVVISHAGDHYELRNQLVVEQAGQKLYNYYNAALVPSGTDEPFELLITLPGGETITGTTRILPAVPIDSVVVQFPEDDTLARLITYLTDIPGQQNYYRRMLHRYSLDSVALQDFTLDDRVVEDVIVFGSAYEFAVGDTVYNTLFHIDRAYYDFLESINNAILSNGNPFGQPSPINSNLEGTARAIGIFTGLTYVREKTVIREP